MIDVNAVKQKIIKYLEDNGLSLPVKIAKAIELEPVFTSAILSELMNVQKVKTSNFRLGASCFYFLEGQESGLEMIGDEYLKGVEKDVFVMLRNEGALKDVEQSPAFRVGLRALKDFAIPFKFNDEIYWRYSLVSKDDIEKKLVGKSDIVEEKVEIEKKEEKVKDESDNDVEGRDKFDSPFNSDVIEDDDEDKKGDRAESEVIDEEGEDEDESESESGIDDSTEEVEEVKKVVFLDEIKDFVSGMNLKLYEIVDDSRNEIVGKVKINSDFGEIVFLVVARNKKSLSHSDILMAKSKADEFKMPLFLISRGVSSKKVQGILDEFSNLIKFESMDE